MAFTASASMSRLLSLSSPTTSISMAAAFSPSKLPFTSSFSFSPLKLKLKPISTLQPRFSSSSSPAITASISVGSKLPDATLSYLDPAGELQTTTIADLTTNKKTIIFAVPGAFTPTCSQKHVPGFIEKSAELKSKGVDVIACISVNDAFVMDAWKKNLGVKDDDVLLLSDGNGDFTRAIGAELDLRDKPVGLGIRSRRYSMLVEDGVVKVLNMEEGGAFTSSGAEDLLKVL